MKKIIYIFSAVVILFSACKKAEFAGDDATGEGLVNFNLRTPSSGVKLVLNAATPNEAVSITWTAATPGLSTAPKYSWVAALKNGGNLTAPILEIPSNNNGAATTLTLTQKQIDDALKSKGIADGATTDFIWSVVATNGDVKIQSTDIFNIAITRMKDGASPFLLLGPTSTLTAQSINPNSTTDFFTFNWTKSKPALGGPVVKYKVLFAERKVDASGNELATDWNAPLFSIVSGSAGVDSFAKVSYKALSDSMTKYGFATLPLPVTLKWTVVATSGTWNQLADYTNNIVIIREVKIFIVGSATPNGWDASKAIRMIPDETNFGTFYMYVYLNAGEMKFLNTQAFPPAPGAVDWGQDPTKPAGNLTADGEVNIPVSTAGNYRVTFDLTNLKFYLQTGRMATVGDATPASWNPPAVFPSQALTLIATNRFLGIVPFNGGGAFKMIDDNSWPSGGGPVNQPRDYGQGATPGSMLEVNETNINGPAAAGNRRIVWDGIDPLNLKYSNTQAKMYLIGGDPAIGNWNNSPGTALPEMTYLGNGLWTVNVTLSGATVFKFIVEKGVWGYQYGDDGSGKAIFRNGDSDPDPNAINIAAGTHTITLNEYTKIYTIM